MSSNSSTIVQDIHREFESLLSYVENAKTEVADQVERHLFERLLAMGAQLIWLFFELHSQDASRTKASSSQFGE